MTEKRLSANAKRRAAWQEAQLSRAASFTVILALGYPTGNLTVNDVPTLSDARKTAQKMLDDAAAAGVKLYTRRPMIYIVTDDNRTVHHENY